MKATFISYFISVTTLILTVSVRILVELYLGCEHFSMYMYHFRYIIFFKTINHKSTRLHLYCFFTYKRKRRLEIYAFPVFRLEFSVYYFDWCGYWVIRTDSIVTSRGRFVDLTVIRDRDRHWTAWSRSEDIKKGRNSSWHFPDSRSCFLTYLLVCMTAFLVYYTGNSVLSIREYVLSQAQRR